MIKVNIHPSTTFECLPIVVVQDRHGQIEASWAETQSEAELLRQEMDKVHGKCDDHFHKAWIMSAKDYWTEFFGSKYEVTISE